MSFMSGFNLIDSPYAHVSVLPSKVTVGNVFIFNGFFQISESLFDIRTIKLLDIIDESC